MLDFLNDNDFRELKQSLPTAFHPAFTNEEASLSPAYPLLYLICKDREVIERLRIALKITTPPPLAEMIKRLPTLIDALLNEFNPRALFKYRLPVVIGEFPIHSRVINKAIASFNELVESLYQNSDLDLSYDDLDNRYRAILKAVKERGGHCDIESLWQLLMMMSGWSKVSPAKLFKLEEQPQVPLQAAPAPLKTDDKPIKVQEITQPPVINPQDPFVLSYNFNVDGAGRLAKETIFLLLNAFGMKFGGHFDAQAKSVPQFIPLAQLHAIIHRQLSHRMEVTSSQSFKQWIEITLAKLGVKFERLNANSMKGEFIVNPFLSEPISFLSPEKILHLLKSSFADLYEPDFKPTQEETNFISQYLYDLLQGFQINPGQALGIGANWDGTIYRSNESGAHAFRIQQNEAPVARRFRDVSLHRQGPAEPHMNAGIGGKIELQALITSHKYMSELQPSEHPQHIFAAIVDNMVTDLFPDSAYFENTDYPKLSLQHVAVHTAEGLIKIEQFFIPSSTGTYFKDRKGKEKQTPMYRRAGALDVAPFPRNTTYCEQSRVWYEGNPLGPLLQQYGLAMSRSARGHIVYDPIAPDQFIEDTYYGQVIRSDNGDCLPFIGVIPKNFDKYYSKRTEGLKLDDAEFEELKLGAELCASFVIRMVNSARIMVHCPTFQWTLEQIKTRFLPDPASQAPALPSFCSAHLHASLKKLNSELVKVDRRFTECEHAFFRVYKNLIYSLYDIGKEDIQFKRIFLSLFNGGSPLLPLTRSKCEKLLRDLTVNRPVQISSDLLSRYDDILIYLRKLTSYFYPTPTDELAQEIAKQARLHVGPLLRSVNVQRYFNDLRLNYQTNLSSQHSPGMVFAVLKHDGRPSPNVSEDYGNMHAVNFPSYYRDSDGAEMGKPDVLDSLLDRFAKTVGATLQVAHRNNLFSVLRGPIVKPYIYAKQRSAQHRFSPNRNLWAVEGAIEGFLWHGLLKGIWETTTTPFQMLFELLSWLCDGLSQEERRIENNPLAISAAPPNTSSLKTQVISRSRDYVLYLISSPGNVQAKRDELITHIMRVINHIYPKLTDEELGLCVKLVKEQFPLDALEWSALFAPLVVQNDYAGLQKLLQDNAQAVNNPLIQAVFKSLTDPNFETDSAKIGKENASFYFLNGKQIELFKKIIAFYSELKSNKRAGFVQLFRSQGVICDALRKRDQLVQRIQSFILKSFNEESLYEYLFAEQIDDLTRGLDVSTLLGTLAKLPRGLKDPLHDLLHADDLAILHRYDLTEKEKKFYQSVLTIYRELPTPKAKDIVLQWVHKANKNTVVQLSAKDKAQHKWAEFMRREYQHQLLELPQARDLLQLINNRSGNFPAEISRLWTSYRTLQIGKNDSLNEFYDYARDLQSKINQRLLRAKASKGVLEAQGLLNDFLNITMNAVVNSRLDQGDLFAASHPVNPLRNCRAIESWLYEMQKINPDFRSLLEQQLQQAPSMDHTLWRCHCILQVLEAQKPGVKIPKTGMQSLLRFWSHDRHVVTNTGKLFVNPQNSEMVLRSPVTLFKGSVTMDHAIQRVQDKGFKLF
ncbi:MAG: hypothetical protein EPN84_01680 [Legionella sp.]|nr:MAG: hypothetical protein EPN84_01680 [Legionella sp.]